MERLIRFIQAAWGGNKPWSIVDSQEQGERRPYARFSTRSGSVVACLSLLEVEGKLIAAASRPCIVESFSRHDFLVMWEG